jgi:SAM-dependent methyltransferase
MQKEIRMTEGIEKYANMQKHWYEGAAARSHYSGSEIIDNVVGSFQEHNSWPDYDRFMFRYVDDSFKDKYALDFACGPGRNIAKYHHLFRRLDGADIAQNNLDNADIYLRSVGAPVPNLYVTSGVNLGSSPDNTYDFIFSTVAMQHICVHETRFSIFQHMYRALRCRGRISIQMGFGVSPGKVGYYENHYDATATNSALDTMVENPDFVENDLKLIGFRDFEYWVRPVGPGDSHPYWIFFTAIR